MSDTPETDAAELIYDGIVASGYADVDVCRKLERERDDAREALQKVASLAHGSADKTVCLIHLNAIQRIAVAALKHEEPAK